MKMVSNGKRWARAIAPDAVNRQAEDYYPTPYEGTLRLLKAETFAGGIREPACGEGHMSRILEEAGYRVDSSDLVDRGFGRGGIDFLLDFRRCDNVVTNPPFKLLDEFHRHAISVARVKVALLCRLAVLEGAGRRQRFEWGEMPLARVLAFSERLKIQRGRLAKPGEGVGMVAFAWFIFERGHRGPWTGRFI